MQSMTLTEIVSAVKGVWWNPGDQIPTVSAVSTDSRKTVSYTHLLNGQPSRFFRASNSASSLMLPSCGK